MIGRGLAGGLMLLTMVTASSLGAQPIYESTPTVVTATIEAVEPSTRVVTLKTAAGSRLHVNAPAEMEGFDRLRVGDIVTARYFEAVALRLARPGSKAPSGTPTTIVRRNDREPGSETRSERTVRATIVAVDAAGQSVTVKGTDGAERTMKVTDASQAKALKAGDEVDVTFYESRLVSVDHPRK